MARTPKSKQQPAAAPAPGGAGFPAGFAPQQPGSSPFPGAGAPGQFPQQVPGQPPAGFPQQGQPSPFGAPTPGFPPAPQNGAPGPFGNPPDPAAGMQQLGAQVNQHTVSQAMQQAGAGVTADPAMAQAIVAISNSIKEIDAALKDLQTKMTGGVSTLAKTVQEQGAKLDQILAALSDDATEAAPQAPAAPQQQAPAAAPQQAAPAQNGQADANAILGYLLQQVKAKYDSQPGQYIQANTQQVWGAFAQMVKQTFNVEVGPQQLYELFQANGKISAADPQGNTYVLA